MARLDTNQVPRKEISIGLRIDVFTVKADPSIGGGIE
jgi:hypothetical protein